MATPDELKAAIDALVQEGEQIVAFEGMLAVYPDEKTRKEAKLGAKLEKLLNEFRLNRSYQAWYAKALPLVEQLLPDRLSDFVEAYKPVRPPKALDPSTYTISDYLAGVVVTRWDSRPEFNTLVVFGTRLELQVAIVSSAKDRLESRLADIRNTLEAELFDDELSAAEELRKKKHLRAAGVVAGVVLERHLKRVCANHAITVRKKNPTIGDLNNLLKDKVYDTPRWREIQLYADIRNYAGHDKERDPTAEEILGLIRGTEQIIKLIF